jgi:hypothetical protein
MGFSSISLPNLFLHGARTLDYVVSTTALPNPSLAVLAYTGQWGQHYFAA